MEIHLYWTQSLAAINITHTFHIIIYTMDKIWIYSNGSLILQFILSNISEYKCYFALKNESKILILETK